MTQGERVNKIRKTLNLTLEKFGEKVGVGKTAISNIEKNKRNVTEQMTKSICREFNVDYLWLTTGQGEMFIQFDDNVYSSIDKIMAGENELHRNLIKWMASLDEKDIDDIDRLIYKYSNITKNE